MHPWVSPTPSHRTRAQGRGAKGAQRGTRGTREKEERWVALVASCSNLLKRTRIGVAGRRG